MAGMVATASILAQFASVYPSAGSFITYLGYIIAFGGISVFAAGPGGFEAARRG
jgi:hypothetical protein